MSPNDEPTHTTIVTDLRRRDGKIRTGLQMLAASGHAVKVVLFRLDECGYKSLPLHEFR